VPRTAIETSLVQVKAPVNDDVRGRESAAAEVFVPRAREHSGPGRIWATLPAGKD
jgi:hypothetical protein